MPLVGIYQCFGHRVRLRILRLLMEGPLCVGQLQQILGASQVEVSKQLGYLKRNGFVESQKVRCWRVYRLPESLSFELKTHLLCLQECARNHDLFREDLKQLGEVNVTLPVPAEAKSLVKRPRPRKVPGMPAWSLEGHLL